MYKWRCVRGSQTVVVALTVSLFALCAHLGTVQAADVKQFTIINVIFDDTKVWLPSTLIVPVNETIELTLVNKLDEPHGFKIEAFGIETVIQPKSKTTVQFTPNQAGLYTYACQMHPPHIGGQLLVMDLEK